MTKELIPFTSFAQFATGIYQNPLAPDIGKRVRAMLLDQVGLQIACAGDRTSRRSVGVARKFAAVTSGSSTVVCDGDKTSAEYAAFTNAGFGHSENYDDVCLFTQVHPGAVIVPAAIAIGEEVQASGEQVLRAIAAGVEVMLRAARLLSPEYLTSAGNTAQLAGAYGAAVAAGLLLGLDEIHLITEMQAAGSVAGGMVEYSEADGSDHAGDAAIAAAAGVRAAVFASTGMVPTRVIPERSGEFFRGGDVADAARITVENFSERLIQDVALKYYNCGYFIDAPLQATLDIVNAVGLEIGDIESISVGVSRPAIAGDVGFPLENTQARRSARFCIALALLTGAPRLGAYSSDNIRNPAVRSLSQRIELYHDTSHPEEYPGDYRAVVTIADRHGEEFVHRVRHPKGSRHSPMTDAELFIKFHSNAINRLSEEQTHELYSTVNRVAELDSISTLTGQMWHGNPAQERHQRAIA